MADIDFPAQAEITRQTINPYEPGLFEYVSQFTGKSSHVFTAPGQWRGTVTIAKVAQRDGGDIGAIMAALSSLRHGAKTLALPLEGVPTIAAPPSPSPAVQSITNDGVLVFDQDTKLKVGNYFKLGDRLYIAQEAPATLIPNQRPGNTDTQVVRITPYPLFAAVVNDALGVADEIDVRLTGNPLRIPRDPGFTGPWTFEWVEDV